MHAPNDGVVDAAEQILQSLPRPSFSDALDAVWSCPTCGEHTDRDPDAPSYVACETGHRFKTPIRIA